MKYLTTIIFALFILISCNDSSNITDPILNTTSQTLSKDGLNQYELIPLPPKSPAWEDSIFTVSKVINGNVGGVIQMSRYYITASGSPCYIYIYLSIPKNAFTGTKNITMTLDDEFAAVHFYPEMVFAKELRLFQSFEGLQLENLPTGTIDFVFIHDDGSIELIKKNGIQIVVPQGIVRFQNAKLLHFSRYGWIRKS
jgi:hypothetical protein